MVLGALVDLGLPVDHLRSELGRLGLTGWCIEVQRVQKHHLDAAWVQVLVEPQHHHRHWADIRRIIESSGLPDVVKRTALAVFERLARAEARVHGIDPEQVHFHEVGAVDAIIDVVGAAIGLHYFGLNQVYSSPLPLGHGHVMAAHGRLPLPAPATLALLEGVPTYGVDLDVELVTPTGAAILTAVSAGFGPRPAMTIHKTGYGAGARNLSHGPNLVRLTLGQAEADSLDQRLLVLETNVDDMNPEVWPYLMDRLLAADALDVWLTPIHMKKGRPGVMLSVLTVPERRDALGALILSESSSIGWRSYPVDRKMLQRTIRTVATPWGDAQVKEVVRPDRTEVVPEYESCRRLARETGLPLREVYDRLTRLARDSGSEPSSIA
jgi:uncharacterized protein (TIGR00299 family) protein